MYHLPISLDTFRRYQGYSETAPNHHCQRNSEKKARIISKKINFALRPLRHFPETSNVHHTTSKIILPEIQRFKPIMVFCTNCKIAKKKPTIRFNSFILYIHGGYMTNSFCFLLWVHELFKESLLLVLKLCFHLLCTMLMLILFTAL